MDLMQSTDQDAIQETVRAFLADELPMERIRQMIDARNFAPLASVWKRAAELGFFALGLPESVGGSGFTLTEEMILFEELGRALAPGPWLGTVLAAHALCSLGDAAATTLLHRVTGGELPVAFAECEAAALAFAGGSLSGRVAGVGGAAVCGALLLLAGDDVVLAHGEGDSLWVEERAGLDPTRDAASVELRNASCLVLARGGAAQRLRREASVLSCAEAVGGIQKTVEMSVEYAKVRTQFGAPIGSFQAVKHRCADMAVRAEVARSATIYATIALRDGAGDADFQVSIAKLLCGEAYIDNAADNVQNHGGMGFTWECDAHLHVKRARSFDLALGSRHAQLDRLVAGFRAPS